jgi:peptidyl-prolyl cis-trans isomerase SurA
LPSSASGRPLPQVIAMLRPLAILVLGLALLVGAAAPAAAATTKVTVNGDAITDFQIAQRLKLFSLEGRSGQQAAVTELVNEALEMQEAKRLGITVTDAEVDSALLQVARNIKVSVEKLKKILGDAGVGVETLRARLRASIAWNRVVDQAVTPTVQLSDLELDKKAQAELTAANSYDYILKEIVFLSTGGSASKRTAEANQYRKSFSGCDNAVKLSQSYRDAAVVSVGRRHATQLPEAIAKELAGLNPGGITRPRVIESGVSMLAVCAKEEARDTTFVKGQIRQQEGTAALKGKADEYLQGLRKKANIVTR